MSKTVAKYQKYAEYKDSGVDWMGEIPSHWYSKPLKYLCTYNDEVLPETTANDAEIQYIDIGSVSAVDGISKIETMIFKGAPSRARRIVRDGDVIVSTVRTYLEAIAPIDNPPENLIVSTGFAVIRPNQYLYKSFASYCLRAKGFIKEVVARSVGVSYPAINSSELVNITIPSIEYAEQVKIANFLDHETAQIDSLITKQEKLIELLKEKRQAVISHAVTKGLNSDVTMKDSGVEWLGQVPEHWIIIKGGYIGTLFGSESIAEEDVLDEGKLPFIKVSSLSLENFKLNSIDWFVTENRAKFCKAEKNYIVFPKRGAAIFTNKVNVVDIDSVIDPNLMGWKIGKNGLTEYFALLLKTRGLDDIADVSTVPQINNKHIAPEKFPLPPLNEQTQIVAFVSLQLEKFDSLINTANSAIQLMQERRTALISSAVTGKIDVRHYASRPSGNDKIQMEGI